MRGGREAYTQFRWARLTSKNMLLRAEVGLVVIVDGGGGDGGGCDR